MVDVALSYAARGWHVIPLVPRTKVPLTEHGLKDGTTDAGVISRWWTRRPDAGVAIVTGKVSGLVVLDVDPGRAGDDHLHFLERRRGALPATVEVLTGGGGRHLYFAHPGGTVPNRAGRFGLDLRGDGGYVVAPPSVHESGRAYAWSVDGDPHETDVAALPEWLQAAAPAANGNGRTPTGAWLELLTGRLLEGRRNDSLTRLTGHLLAHGIAPAVVLELVGAVNERRCSPPLAATEVERIVRSIAGREEARSCP